MSNFVIGLVASLIAALLLFAGAELVFEFGFLAFLYVAAFVRTVLNIVRVALMSAVFAPLAIAAVAAGIYFLPIGRIARSQVLTAAHAGYRQSLRNTIDHYLAMPSVDRIGYSIARLTVIVIATTIGSLCFSGSDSWNEVSGTVSPTLAPVGRTGQITNVHSLRHIAEVTEYNKSRHERIAATAAWFVSRFSRSDVIDTRCGGASVPMEPELRKMAELAVDILKFPPIIKREYFLTEEELTGLMAKASRDDSLTLLVDCVELHHGYVKLFMTDVRPDGSKGTWAVGLSVTKNVGASLSMVLDEVSIGSVSFQLGWLGAGALGGGVWGFGARTTKVGQVMLHVFNILDSRVFSIDVNEGYVRVVTWRLPSVIAARAAYDVGYVASPVEYRARPELGAESLGNAAAGDIVYSVQNRDAWIYVCSEVNGRFGWIPMNAFRRLE